MESARIIERLPVAGIAAMLIVIAAPVWSATFRQIPDVPTVPPAIEHPAERDLLVQDVEKLSARRQRLIDLRRSFASQCDQRRIGGVMSRSCQFRQVEIRRDTSRFRTDVLALRDRLRRIEAGVQRRRLAGGDPTSAAGPAAADRRFEIVRNALSVPGGTWHSVLSPFARQAARAAGDPAYRDAAAYLVGMHHGHLASMKLENPFYKHGVRRALAGDHWSAAVAFARAARDNPDDPLVYAAFAAAAGRQHASPACARAGRCVRGSLADWAARFGSGNRTLTQQLERNAARADATPGVRAAVRALMAVSVYGDSGPATTAKRLVNSGHSTPDDLRGAALNLLRTWAAGDAARARIFAARYDAAGEPNRVSSLLGYQPTRPKRLRDTYLAKLQAAFAAAGKANPFSGYLSREQLIGLQK